MQKQGGAKGLIPGPRRAPPGRRCKSDTYTDARKRVLYLKDAVENKGLYRILWRTENKREEDVQMLYRLVWFGSPSDVNREVNNGRGAVDFKISRGAADRCIVEFKLASSSKLKRNLRSQVAIYQTANDAARALTVIVYFTEPELVRLQRILIDLSLNGVDDVVLIDARRDNKPSASVA